MYETRHVQYRINSGYVSIMVGEQPVRAFWAHPEASGQFPGLVVLHENLTAQTRSYVRRLAEIGFYVVAPDLYDDLVEPTREALQRQFEQFGRERVTAAIDVLRTHNRCNGKVGLIGWGMGGELAYEAALRYSDLNAVVVYYGRPEAYISGLATDDTPILAIYGDNDQVIMPTTLNHLSQALADAPARNRLVIYPEMQAGFCDPDSATYHPGFAEQAWLQTLDFLREQLDIRIVRGNTNVPF